MHNYNLIAPFYVILKRMVFGKVPEQLTKTYLSHLVNCKHLLIIGGGTGKELEYLNQINFKGKITFIEPSSMISEARKRRGKLNIDFRKEYWPVKDIKPYDGIITSFFLDQYSGKELITIVSSLEERLTKGGLWINSDFIPSDNRRKAFLLKIMYLFFRITTGLENQKLEIFDTIISEKGLKIQKSSIGKEWLRSTLFVKPA